MNISFCWRRSPDRPRFYFPLAAIALRPGLCALVWLGLATSLTAQEAMPVATAPLPDRTFDLGDAGVSVDLRNHFEFPGVTGQLVQFDTVFGKFNVEMLPAAAPISVANFLGYVGRGDYTNTIIHRSIASFVIQGGGVYAVNSLAPVPPQAPIVLEYNLPNARGTVAMARGDAADSATCEWFINTVDNTTLLDQSNKGGYAVFGRVVGTGMTVVDALAAVPAYNMTGYGFPHTHLPLINGRAEVESLVVVRTISSISIFPTGSGSAAISFTLVSSNPSVATLALNGSDLSVIPAAPGTTTVTVTATDANGNAATRAFELTVIGPDPIAQTITFAALADVAFSATPISLVASASSGLAVTFSVVSGPATIDGSTLTLDAVGPVTVRATQAGNAAYLAAPVVERTFSVTSPQSGFAAWRQSTFTSAELANPAISGANADPDHDGLANLLEYALGFEPRTAASTSGLPGVAASASEWTYTYTRPSDRSDVTYAVEISPNLTSWTTTNVTHELVSTNAVAGTQTWRARVPLTTGANVFFRLKVETP